MTWIIWGWAYTWNRWACMVSIREAWTTHGKGSNHWPCETLANHFKACGLEPRPKSMWKRPSPSKGAQDQGKGALQRGARGSLLLSLSFCSMGSPSLTSMWPKWAPSPLLAKSDPSKDHLLFLALKDLGSAFHLINPMMTPLQPGWSSLARALTM